MIKISNGLNLKERRYSVYECPLCGSVYAVRKLDENENQGLLSPDKIEAQEKISVCETCGCDNLVLVRFRDDHQAYINTMRPYIVSCFGIHNNEKLMKELYIFENNKDEE